uniref:Uncharacterized protein n=1 Tax=Gordonia phage Petito TaxID=3158876 RepID=A0AAU8GPS5_9CAUD
MGKHRKKDGEPRSPFFMGSVHNDESIARHSLNEESDVKIVENSYSVWREPVAE